MRSSSITSLLLLASTCIVSGALLPLHRHHRRQDPNLSRITQTQNGETLRVEVQVNGQTFYLNPDTGSSDLWVPTTDFQCVDPDTNLFIPQESCHFGATYDVPESTEYVANQTFGVQYGTGIALGKVAKANVTVNGITVEQQKVGLVDRTNDIGDGLGSGILGLGFPPVTSAHPGTKLDNTTLLVNRAVYDPVFVSMYKQDLVEPWYSFALERPLKNTTQSPGGWLGLGELPPVKHSDDWAVAPIEATNSLPESLTGGKNIISLMTLTVDGVTWGDKRSGESVNTNMSSFQAVVDTGHHMNLLPQKIADSINDLFKPPGIYDEEYEIYVVDCNATTPELAFILDGQTFWHNSPDDLIYHDMDGGCYSSIAPTGEDGDLALNFLGDAFLRNVVSVFDFEREEMRFARRTDDESGDGDDDHGGSGPDVVSSAGSTASVPLLTLGFVVLAVRALV